jgi:hypothetical protein
VLTLYKDKLEEDLWIEDLDIVPMANKSELKDADALAGGQLEMFLDLVGYLATTSAAFFLDKTYDDLSADEKPLREALTGLSELIEKDPKKRSERRGTVAYEVRKFLRAELGADADQHST